MYYIHFTYIFNIKDFIELWLWGITIVFSYAAITVNMNNSTKNNKIIIAQQLNEYILKRVSIIYDAYNHNSHKDSSLDKIRLIRIVTEIVITLQILDENLLLYKNNDVIDLIPDREVFKKMIWYQLNTSIRIDLMNSVTNFKTIEDKTFKSQLDTIKDEFRNYF